MKGPCFGLCGFLPYEKEEDKELECGWCELDVRVHGAEGAGNDKEGIPESTDSAAKGKLKGLGKRKRSLPGIFVGAGVASGCVGGERMAEFVVSDPVDSVPLGGADAPPVKLGVCGTHTSGEANTLSPVVAGVRPGDWGVCCEGMWRLGRLVPASVECVLDRL